MGEGFFSEEREQEMGVPQGNVLSLTLFNIKIFEQYKYIEVIFDHKLSFIPHHKYLRTKCNKTMQLLRTIAHINWGGSKETLLKLYCSLIIPKPDYGWLIYGAARKTYLKELNTIDHQGLRLALGA